MYFIDPDGNATKAQIKFFYESIGRPIIKALISRGVSQNQAYYVVGQILFEQGYVPDTKHKKAMWDAYALFNVKGKGPNGSVETPTHEVINGVRIPVSAKFRAYNNMQESLDDYLDLLKDYIQKHMKRCLIRTVTQMILLTDYCMAFTDGNMQLTRDMKNYYSNISQL